MQNSSILGYVSNSGYAWLLVTYRLPPSPTRHRAWAWREVRRSGGVYLHDGVFALPQVQDLELDVDSFVQRMLAAGGSCIAFYATSFNPEQQAALIARFNAERDREYGPIAQAADRIYQYFEEEVDHWTFTPVELRRIGDEIGRLRRRLIRVQSRDYFAADGGRQALAKLDACEARWKSH